ncbi:hypothetical protein [Sphingomonas sp.]|uniref:hypothetical protein n=1 Tax=Sphingomonas sp. TaxID=28214 RepID=UPI0025D31BB0|nr:hypothetical protein [Sphingomonas sp.]
MPIQAIHFSYDAGNAVIPRFNSGYRNFQFAALQSASVGNANLVCHYRNQRDGGQQLAEE